MSQLALADPEVQLTGRKDVTVQVDCSTECRSSAWVGLSIVGALTVSLKENPVIEVSLTVCVCVCVCVCVYLYV